MSRFLVESPIAGDADALDGACELARRAAEGCDGVGYVRTTFLPGATTVLHLFDASSVGAIERAGRRVGLEIQRIVAAADDEPT